ncbi:poly-gamma-glutamate synthesis protein (capsule biosynthesis protein) [Salinibacillus kushneri]|uniref:Poly-gamma-glutamate synthesis protein (Capsule biosynthesis protein) n=1 Tax=Salinibacillus kushneri TaxID=237682 RepID=A0A1I0DZI6_9BACI|nr:CapA family protein [Salinibacillus kushneri]SET38113.1 poly-gamma-glutamate synthesis protein (capsule biosynthesis protein) [Salinibacillus kushneri]
MNKWSWVLTSIFGVIILLFMIFLLTIGDTNHESNELTVHQHQKVQSQDMKSKEIHSEITLGAVGDILVHNTVYEDARTSNGFDFMPMFHSIKNSMKKPDIMFANQETMIGGQELGLSSYPQFNSPYSVGDALKDAGVDVVSMANNHTLDAGEQGILNATSHFNQLNISYVGANRSQEDQQRDRILHAKGISVGFLAYTYGTNGLQRPADKPYLVQYIDDDTLIDDIKELKTKVDFVVVSLHFGQQYQRLANDVQKIVVDKASEAGADVILGHHPHVLQPAEWITKENGERTFVIYSLGNFLSGQSELYQRIGGILHIKLEKSIDQNNETQYGLSGAKIMPTYMYRPNYKNYKIIPLKKADEYGLHEAKELYQEIQEHMKTYTDKIEVVSDL